MTSGLPTEESAKRYLNQRISVGGAADLPTTKKTRKSVSRPQRLSGKWKIVEMPDLSDDYLSLSKDPNMILTLTRRSVSGHYQYGLCDGELEGEVIESEGRPLEIRFSFEGVDENDDEHGYGEAIFSDDDKTLTGKLHIHAGDTWRFTCRRR